MELGIHHSQDVYFTDKLPWNNEFQYGCDLHLICWNWMVVQRYEWFTSSISHHSLQGPSQCSDLNEKLDNTCKSWLTTSVCKTNACQLLSCTSSPLNSGLSSDLRWWYRNSLVPAHTTAAIRKCILCIFRAIHPSLLGWDGCDIVDSVDKQYLKQCARGITHLMKIEHSAATLCL